MSKTIIGYLTIFIITIGIGAGYFVWIRQNPTTAVAPIPEPDPIKEYTLTNINYAETADIEQNLDLYIPAAKNYPVVVFIHGGAWMNGQKESYQYVGKFFQAKGIGCAVINYRLSPRVKFPVHAQDSAKAISWVYQNINKYGGDQNKLYVSGHSAGAHLASLVALDGSYLTAEKTPNIIKGVISVSGTYKIVFYGFRRVFNRSSRGIASPIDFVKPGAPAFIIFYAEKDIPTLPVQAINFNDALIKAGNSSKLILYRNQDHSTIVANLFKAGEPYESDVTKFITGEK